MRSIRTLAAVTATLLLGSACGDGGGTPPPDNRPPVASFAEVCTALSCVFTDASADPDEGGTVTAWSWNFGEPTSATNTATVQNPTHAYAATGAYTVTLTATDNEGAVSPVFSKTFTVTAAPPVNTPPTAAFTFTCDAARACVFTNGSTDADGTIATHAWDFGEPASGTANTSTEANPTHTYAAVTQRTNFTVTLTVTDDDGAPSAAVIQTVTIDPPPVALCTGSGKVANCLIDLLQKSTLTVTLVSRSCDIGGNKFEVSQPLPLKAFFFNGCFQDATGQRYSMTNADGTPRVFEIGQVQLRFTQGTLDAGDPPAGPPVIRIEGSHPSWTFNIDDGGRAGQSGEPDYTDLILLVEATRVQ